MGTDVAEPADGTATGTVDMALMHAMHLLDTRPDMALMQARAVQEAVPGHPQAQLLIGQALRRLGDLKGARAVLAPLAAAQPRSAATAMELGLVAALSGENGLAVSSLRRATRLKPDFAPAWTELAFALRTAGQEDEAAQADLAAVRASTRDPVLIEAAVALGEGRLEVAEPLLRGRLKRNPTDVAATRMLGELAWRLGRVDDAITLLYRAVELAPAFEAARDLLARVLGLTLRIDEALEQTTRLMAAHPGNPLYATRKAGLLVRIGEQDAARQLYDQVLATNPNQPTIWMNLGHVLKTLGRQGDAVAAYRRALALSPTLGEAWWSLANLKTVRFDAGDIAAMKDALTGVSDRDDALHLHFALGKAQEDREQDAEAFAHYAEGNRLRREDLDYDADATERRSRAQAALFDRAFLAARAGEGHPAPDPIFVLGLPRAGSTLVEQILASHSRIEGTMELPDLMMIGDRLESRVEQGEFASYADVLRALGPADRARLGEEYIERTRIHRKTDKPYFIDKMPNNWQHVGLIQLILPQAKIVDARRHPLGCCFSGWKQHFARGQAFTYDLSDIGRYYRAYVAQMAAFDAAMPGRVHRVIYERMVADTPGEVTRLLEYVGVPFEEDTLAFWRNRRAVRTASSEQVRQPIFTDAVKHWQRFEPWLGPLVAALGDVVEAYPDVPEGLEAAPAGA